MRTMHPTPLEGEAPAEPRRTGRSALHAGAFALALFICAGSIGAEETWQSVRWHDEQAYELETTPWRAIVSVERGRLVHFGPARSEINFVFAPATKDAPDGWGGHRVWLGPQVTWKNIWPPPDAWEKSAPEKVASTGSRLELTLPGAGDGWPRISRVYELVDGKLACRVLVAAGGKTMRR